MLIKQLHFNYMTGSSYTIYSILLSDMRGTQTLILFHKESKPIQQYYRLLKQHVAIKFRENFTRLVLKSKEMVEMVTIRNVHANRRKQP